jgi:hypothetical protein
VHELVTELKSSVTCNTLHEKFQHHYQPKDVDALGKHKLLTPKKKCLFSSDTKDDLTGQSSRNSTGTADNVDVNTDSDDVLSKLNIDGLKTCEGRLLLLLC